MKKGSRISPMNKTFPEPLRQKLEGTQGQFLRGI